MHQSSACALKTRSIRSSAITSVRRITTNLDNAHSQQQGWKLLSMTDMILASLAILTLLIIASVEILAQRSSALGGLAISPTLDDIPAYAMWSYLYGPNLVAVLYSLIWNWVDLDVRRMQPWIELSKEEGATAEDSLLLDYPFDFVAFAPWKAAKKSAMLLVLWAITPLQSALLATGAVSYVEHHRLSSRKILLDVSNQRSKMDATFRGTIYYTTWLNLSLPSFTTSEYALAPFEVSLTSHANQHETNITGRTTKLSSELLCSTAKIVIGDFEPTSNGKWSNTIPIYFLDDNGCNSTIYPDDIMAWEEKPDTSMRYWGSYSEKNFFDLEPMDGNWRWELASPECPHVKNRFIATWMKQKYNDDFIPPDLNISGIWCDVTYWKQPVRVTLTADTLTPIPGSMVDLGSRERLTDEEFNSTAFEQFMRRYPLDEIATNLYDIELFSHESFLFGTDLADVYSPVDQAVGYALAVDMLDTEEYANTETLAHAYKVAWKSQFALMANHLMVNSSEIRDDDLIELERPMVAIIVSRLFATALETLLGAVAAITLALLWLCRKATTKLRANPSSISRIGLILGDSPEVCLLLSSVGATHDNELEEHLRGRRFRLMPADADSITNPRIEQLQDSMALSAGSDNPEKASFFSPIRPFVLKKRSGVLFATAITGAIVGLTYLKAADNRDRGLQRPTNNFEVLQLLENYLPTIFATLVEPFWVMLNRLLCMLQPFKELCQGRALTKTSIDATYTAIPPQLAVWRALASRHFILVMVCSTALLANLLALSMGALFNEEPIQVQVPGKIAAAFAPRVERAMAEVYVAQGRFLFGGPMKPYIIRAQANITDSLELPPWTSSEFFFRPGSLDYIPSARNYTVATHGFGLEANCTAFPAKEIQLSIPNTKKEEPRCDQRLDDVDEEMRKDLGWTSDFDSGRTFAKYTYTRHSHPVVTYVSANDTLDCDPQFVWGWGRTKASNFRNSSALASKIFCQPSFQFASFNVTVDDKGSVLSYDQTSEPSNTLPDKGSRGHIRMMINLLHDGGLLGRTGWYNDTSYHSVIDMLLVRRSNMTSLLDPKEPPPDTEKLLSSLEYIYRQLFVLMLASNPSVFADAGPEDTLAVISHVEEVRIFMNGPAFVITIAILVINIMTTLVFYAQTSTLVLPRLPTTIGSVIAYIAPSRLVTEGRASDATYSFGRYVCQDGKTHVGIERDPYVVPIVPGSLGEKRPLVRRMRWNMKHAEKEKGPWL